MRLSVVKEQEAGNGRKTGIQRFYAGNGTNRNLVQELKFTVPGENDTCHVVVRVEKTGSGRPVLSFINMVPEKIPETFYTISGIVTEKEKGVADLVSISMNAETLPLQVHRRLQKQKKAEPTHFRSLRMGPTPLRCRSRMDISKAVKVIEGKRKSVTDADLELTRKEEPEKTGENQNQDPSCPEKTISWESSLTLRDFRWLFTVRERRTCP